MRLSGALERQWVLLSRGGVVVNTARQSNLLSFSKSSIGQGTIFIVWFLVTLMLALPVQAAVTLQRILPGGWSLISLPIMPADGAPEAVFADVPPPLRLYAYQDGQFIPADDAAFPAIQAGQAYWIHLEGKTPISVTGDLVNPAAPASVLLHPGWNQVACPWGWPFDWEDGQISIYNGTSTLSLTQAKIQGWIEGDLYDYQTTSGTYAKIEPDAMVNGQMQPWKGYLLYSNIDALLQFAPPGPEQQILFGNLE